ncbi:MAG: 30S ribosomal protein S18 [Chloroflexota bacterium]
MADSGERGPRSGSGEGSGERGGDGPRRPYRGGGEGGDRPRGGRRGVGRARVTVCAVCEKKAPDIDYKDVNLLHRYVAESGFIQSRRRMGTCARHQRMLARAIKRARYLALLPTTSEHVRRLG